MEAFMEKQIKHYEMTTFTKTGAKYSHGIYKTRRAKMNAKDKYDNKYGAYLTSKVIVHYIDGTFETSF
jgi:hypothetical protein